RAHYDLGLALCNLGEIESAVKEFNQAISLRGGSYADAHYELGRLYALEQKPDLALQSFETAIAQNENFPEAYNALGQIHYQAGRLPEAAGAYRKAITQRGGEFARAHHNLGVALFDLAQDDEAISEFSEAIKQQPAFPKAYRNLGRALYRKGE